MVCRIIHVWIRRIFYLGLYKTLYDALCFYITLVLIHKWLSQCQMHMWRQCSLYEEAGI